MRGGLSNIHYRATQTDSEYIFGDSISAITENAGTVDVKFNHGDSRGFDLVIGADGLHSNVRGLVFGDESQFIKHLGYYISIFTVPNIMSLNTEALFYGTLGKRMALYGIGRA